MSSSRLCRRFDTPTITVAFATPRQDHVWKRRSLRHKGVK